MTKKRKQKSTPKTSRESWHKGTADYTDPRKVEAMVKDAFTSSVANLRSLEKDHPGLVSNMDMETHQRKRRIQAVINTTSRIRDLAKELCPDTPGFYSIAEDWAAINSLPIGSYNLQEDDMDLTVGAAIWMLDHIKQDGKIDDAVRILPKGEVSIPNIYDPVHDDMVIRSMVHAIRHRNDDCLQDGQKRKRKTKADESLNRFLVDAFTAQRLQHQDVPSRVLFEKLLDMVPEEDIRQAISSYEDKLFQWMECYFRCRNIYRREEEILERRQKHFDMSAHIRMDRLMEQKEQKNDPILEMSSLRNVLPGASFSPDAVNSMQLLHELETESRRLEDDVKSLEKQIARFAVRSRSLGSYPHTRVERDYGEKIADIVADFTPGDPYTMCFALLYLLDTDSDLPWLYYPGTVISENAGAMLPWYNGEYDEIEDIHSAQYYDSDYQPSPLQVKGVPPLADWYRLDYVRKKDELDFQYKTNLAQMVFDVTGGLMPRNLHRYDDAVEHLREYGITGKKMQIPLLYCMMILGESRDQSFDWRMGSEPGGTFLDDLLNADDEIEEENSPEEMPDDHAEEQLSALKQENARLKQLAYEAEKENRALRKQNEELGGKSQAERRELAELRELLFLRENEPEPEEAEIGNEISLPYAVTHATVIFGGHDTWTKAIRPMLAGDVRFVDRRMNPDTNLIRHADVVWLQPNSLRHADYYKIINIIRTHKKQLHYFRFASAEKCARQLAEVDMTFD